MCAVIGLCLAVDLKPQTIQAFDGYIASADARMQQRWSGEHFLWFDDSPEIRSRLLAGAVVAQPVQGNGIVALPGGLIQDWVGAVFVPKTTLKETIGLVQDYPQHPQIYKPDVADVKVLSHTGNDYAIRTRVVKSKFFISDVVDIDTAELKETPSLGSKASVELIKGLAAVADRMLILLNVDELIRRDLAQAETSAVAGAA